MCAFKFDGCEIEFTLYVIANVYKDQLYNIILQMWIF